VIDYAPPLAGASPLAIFRLFADSESEHLYLVLEGIRNVDREVISLSMDVHASL